MMNVLVPSLLLIVSINLLSNVEPVHCKGLGAAAMFLPPGCKELLEEIQKKVEVSSPKLEKWTKDECDRQCKGKNPFSEAIKYQDWGFTFVDKMNEWLKKQKPALDIYTLCPRAFNKRKMLMISGEVKKVCLDTTPFGQQLKKAEDLCHTKDKKEFKEFSDCVKKFIRVKVLPRIMAEPPMDCIPKLKPYCSNRRAVLGWFTFWMDTTFAKRDGKLGDESFPNSWNPYKVLSNYYSNKCKAVASDTRNAVKVHFPRWSEKMIIRPS